MAWRAWFELVDRAVLWMLAACDRGAAHRAVAECAGKSADYIVDSLFKAVAEHAAGVETFDDQTVVAIRVKSSSPSSQKKK